MRAGWPIAFSPSAVTQHDITVLCMSVSLEIPVSTAISQGTDILIAAWNKNSFSTTMWRLFPPSSSPLVSSCHFFKKYPQQNLNSRNKNLRVEGRKLLDDTDDQYCFYGFILGFSRQLNGQNEDRVTVLCTHIYSKKHPCQADGNISKERLWSELI